MSLLIDAASSAHTVVQEAPAESLVDHPDEVDSVSESAFALSAPSKKVLAQLIAKYSAATDVLRQVSFNQLCAATCLRRQHHRYRVAVVAKDIVSACGQASTDVSATVCASSSDFEGSTDRKIIFMFTGQGAQMHGMGRQLCNRFPAFKDSLFHVAGLIKMHLHVDVISAMFEEQDPALSQTLLAQSTTFAFQHALVQLWSAFGVTADAVLGHSAGELSGLCAAEVWSLEDAVKAFTVVQEARTPGEKCLISHNWLHKSQR